MKHRDLIKKFVSNGWWKLREGSNHEVYTDGNKCEAVPRHKEINENLARAIIKRNGFK